MNSLNGFAEFLEEYARDLLLKSSPWLIPRQSVKDHGPIDSQGELLAFGFELEVKNVDFYTAIIVPEGWIRVATDGQNVLYKDADGITRVSAHYNPISYNKYCFLNIFQED